jgi:hypothetical protein
MTSTSARSFSRYLQQQVQQEVQQEVQQAQQTQWINQHNGNAAASRLQ